MSTEITIKSNSDALRLAVMKALTDNGRSSEILNIEISVAGYRFEAEMRAISTDSFWCGFEITLVGDPS